MTNKQTISGLCLTFILLLPGFLRAQNRFAVSSTVEVKNAVIQQRDYWLHLFPDDDLTSFGFNSLEEKNNAVPGEPITVYHMFRDYNGNPNVQSAEEYLVPLIVMNEVRAFITVAYFEGSYQVVNGGEMNLAKDASPFIMQHHKSGTPLIWVKQLNYAADFIAVNTSSEPALQPLFTAKRAMVTEATSYKAAEQHFQSLPLSFNF